MSKTLLTAIALGFLVFSTHAQQQPAPWSKTQREGLYNEGLSMLSSYKGISQEQKESLALCYLEEITKKHDATEYSQKIEVELKRIRSTAMEQCSKNIGVALKVEEEKKPEPKKEEVVANNKLNMANLAGTWLDDSESFNLTPNGTYLYEASTRKCNGSWSLNESTLAFMPSDNVANKFALCKAEEFSVVKFTGAELILLKTGTNKKLTLKRVI